MTPMQSPTSRRLRRWLPWLAALLLVCAAGAPFAQEVDPPGRVGHLSLRQGGVVFAPQGEDEWLDLPQNRPITTGDRLWSDRGARAELQIGTATLHLDGQSHFGVGALDDRTAQFILQQGSVQARVRELQPGENFEIGTPNLALRVLQPGDYRLDVDSNSGETRVTVQSGLATVFGDAGQTLNLGPGQQASFAGRSLAQVQAPALPPDDFAAWAAERNRLEDQSIAARYVPRGVVGYPELDQHGVWSQDATLGPVWYPQVNVADWAPYRYGHWSWIHPWGWTWIDDAAWGFAPFHYGRWTMLANRWAWVPGRMAARPVYAPALVVFLGGGASHFSVNAGPGVGWYPLAPGEAWWPAFRSSPRYVSHANHNVNLNAYPRNYDKHVWRQWPHAVTAVREDDFRRGRPVYQSWQRVAPQMIGQAQVGVVPARPERRWDRGAQGSSRLLSSPPAGVQQSVPAARMWSGREAGAEVAPLVREQRRAQFEQERLQRDAERTARDQHRQQEQSRRQQDSRLQQEQVRQQQERGQRENWQRQQQQQVQQQQAQQQQAVRQQEQAARQEARQRQQSAPGQPAPLYRVQPSPPQPAQQPRDGRGQGEGDDNRGRGGGRGHGGRG